LEILFQGKEKGKRLIFSHPDLNSMSTKKDAMMTWDSTGRLTREITWGPTREFTWGLTREFNWEFT
jgi:hypothetical protein